MKTSELVDGVEVGCGLMRSIERDQDTKPEFVAE
jgi:hypothetical protein